MSPVWSVVATHAVDLGPTLRTLGILRGDPTVRVAPGRFARATVTPDGIGVIALRWRAQDPGSAEVTTAGPGGKWLRARIAAMVGSLDDVTGFDPAEPPLRDQWRRHRRVRIPRTGTLWHDLAATIVQQRINTADAADQWRRLVRGLGTTVADPFGGRDLLAPPVPDVVGALQYHHFHEFGIERRRADTLRAAARVVHRLDRLVDGDAATATPALRAVPGVGPWTASSVAATTWGDRDTVIVGDYGIPTTVAWFLAGEPAADDARLLELLEPYRPHRYRVIRLALGSGARPPRHHPRAARRDIRRH